ncbi:MAG: TetR family transcriptional regulator C-terminal domain-containing protein [Paracoccaceae bacterium]
MKKLRPKTRIQRKNTAAILDAALEVFSQHGFRGATLDQIAKSAGLSKPNMLYYFASKEEIHTQLLSELMVVWLDPLRALDPLGDPIEEIVGYVLRKLEMSRELPRESRLFANEIIQGAPRIMNNIKNDLHPLVEEKCNIIQGWVDAGKIVNINPKHLIFSIWSTTQHYADFDVQIQALLAPEQGEKFNDAAVFLETLYRRALTPNAQKNADLLE